jgi:hypothetical protein
VIATVNIPKGKSCSGLTVRLSLNGNLQVANMEESHHAFVALSQLPELVRAAIELCGRETVLKAFRKSSQNPALLSVSP